MNNIASPQGHYARIRQRFLSVKIDGTYSSFRRQVSGLQV